MGIVKIYTCPNCNSELDSSKFYIQNGSEMGKCKECEDVFIITPNLKCNICAITATHRLDFSYYCDEHFFEKKMPIFLFLLILFSLCTAVCAFGFIHSILSNDVHLEWKIILGVIFVGMLLSNILIYFKRKNLKKSLEEIKLSKKKTC